MLHGQCEGHVTCVWQHAMALASCHRQVNPGRPHDTSFSKRAAIGTLSLLSLLLVWDLPLHISSHPCTYWTALGAAFVG